jgi:hypothetical protein
MTTLLALLVAAVGAWSEDIACSTSQSNPSCSTSQPCYALNRDWSVDLATHESVIHLVADGVTLDVRGFAIAFGSG